MTGWTQDLRYAARSLRASPLFSVVTILPLALGLGVNTSIFSLVNAVLLRPPPGVAEPERLVAVFTSDFSGPAFGASSYPDFVDFRAGNPKLAGLAAYAPSPVSLGLAGGTERAIAEVVSDDYFAVLGVRPPLGRAFVAGESAAPGAEPVTVVSHALWKGELGGDPGIVGRALRVNGRAFTVVGVTPPGFTSLLRPCSFRRVAPPGSIPSRRCVPSSRAPGRGAEAA